MTLHPRRGLLTFPEDYARRAPQLPDETIALQHNAGLTAGGEILWRAPKYHPVGEPSFPHQSVTCCRGGAVDGQRASKPICLRHRPCSSSSCLSFSRSATRCTSPFATTIWPLARRPNSLAW